VLRAIIGAPVNGRIPILAAGLAAGVLASAPAGAVAPTASAPCTQEDRGENVLCLINARRAERGMTALNPDRGLGVAAQRGATSLGITGPLVHERGRGTAPESRLAAAGYGGGTAKRFIFGEVLGRGSGTSAAPDQRVAGWMADGEIRRTLLSSRFKDAGIGVVAADGVATYVVDVGTERRGGGDSGAQGTKPKKPKK
jgi:uncharacterized protein YkwD